MQIRTTNDADLAEVMQVHRDAFGQEEEAALTEAILADPGARPLVSLLACENNDALGHLLFSAVRLERPGSTASASLLAPLAVVPNAQRKGVGSKLVEAGFAQLRRAGVALVFVLGDPNYYSRFGFAPAAPLGFTAPFDLPPAYAEAWMVTALGDALPAGLGGKVVCCDALMQPALWQE